ncbi:MAG TPA: outer membrane beta-barrel protein [bacterium]|nr:outer membrane beta-barrel protein [bacterium]
MERKWAAAAVLLAALAVGAPARADGGKGAMQIGLSSHCLWPQADADSLDPAFDYGVIFHYWLNSTTSIMAGVEMLSLNAPLLVDGKDEGITFSTTALMAGVRYRPKIDLWLRPYAELGVGYQSWQTNPGLSELKSRSGSSVLYFAGGGLSYDFRHALTAGVNVRYLYFPMNENLESRALHKTGKKYNVTTDPFENVGFVTAGVELVWKFK